MLNTTSAVHTRANPTHRTGGIGSWKYKIVTLPSGATERIEKELNELGEDRWECFHILVRGPEMQLFLKKKSRSYLQAIPVGDALKLLTGMGGGDGGAAE